MSKSLKASNPAPDTRHPAPGRSDGWRRWHAFALAARRTGWPEEHLRRVLKHYMQMVADPGDGFLERLLGWVCECQRRNSGPGYVFSVVGLSGEKKKLAPDEQVRRAVVFMEAAADELRGAGGTDEARRAELEALVAGIGKVHSA